MRVWHRKVGKITYLNVMTRQRKYLIIALVSTVGLFSKYLNLSANRLSNERKDSTRSGWLAGE